MELRAKIANVLSPAEIAINVGLRSGVAEGNLVNVYRTIEITDPTTGEPLGTVRRVALHLRVHEVHESFSLARIVPVNPITSSLFGRLEHEIANDRVALGSRVRLDIGDEVSVQIPDEQLSTDPDGDSS